MSEFRDTLSKKAVALSYDEKKQAAPVIVASGMGYMAEKIVEIANENGVPVYEDNSLATVLTQLELGSEIPPALYQAIVDIYAYFLHFVPDRVPEQRIGAVNSDSAAAPDTAAGAAGEYEPDIAAGYMPNTAGGYAQSNETGYASDDVEVLTPRSGNAT